MIPSVTLCYDLPLVKLLLPVDKSLPVFQPCRFPNNFWGWGGEDDELGHRLELQVRTLAPPAVPRFKLLLGAAYHETAGDNASAWWYQ